MAVTGPTVTILLAFLVAIAAFGTWTAYLVHDAQRRRPLPLFGPGAEVRRERSISRLRLTVVVLTFLVWSLLLSEHLRPRR
jgi:hypothetical protein